MAICVEPGCNNRSIAQKRCNKHYKRRRQDGTIEIVQPSMSLRERFEQYVDRTTTPDGCHEWIGRRTDQGYGQFHVFDEIKGRLWPRVASRIAWELSTGTPPPADLKVLHHCDNPPCVQTEPTTGYPDGHLFLGTTQDNVDDRESKGRGFNIGALSPALHARGSRNGLAKLTEDQVREIRSRYAAGGISQRELGEEYGLSQSAVGRIVARRTWTHI